jgi:hypothetical protein
LENEAKHDSEVKDAVQKIEHFDNASLDPEAVTEKKSDDGI